METLPKSTQLAVRHQREKQEARQSQAQPLTNSSEEPPLPRLHITSLAACVLTAPLLALPATATAVEGMTDTPTVSTPKAAQDFCRITASSATVRAKPRTRAAALGVAYKNDRCTAHGWAEGDGTWVKVTVKRTGVTGYVHSSLVVWGKEGLVDTGP